MARLDDREHQQDPAHPRIDEPTDRAGAQRIVGSCVDYVNAQSQLRNPRFSLCLQGPPGTVKSVFVRYLAERMGLEIMQKRFSDLMSMWVASSTVTASSWSAGRTEPATCGCSVSRT